MKTSPCYNIAEPRPDIGDGQIMAIALHHAMKLMSCQKIVEAAADVICTQVQSEAGSEADYVLADEAYPAESSPKSLLGGIVKLHALEH